MNERCVPIRLGWIWVFFTRSHTILPYGVWNALPPPLDFVRPKSAYKFVFDKHMKTDFDIGN